MQKPGWEQPLVTWHRCKHDNQCCDGWLDEGVEQVEPWQAWCTACLSLHLV